MSPLDVCSLAQDLAREGFAVFPCRDDGTSACPDGIRDASNSRPRIAWLWQSCPGPLIGIATGARSSIWVLCIDLNQPEANTWWQTNASRLASTRTYETRSGGLHLYYSAGQGIGCTTSRICRGVDTKGEGDYVVHWHSAGFECHDHSPPAPWPAFLRDALTPPPPPLPASYRGPAPPPEASVAGILTRLSLAQEGERDAVLLWGARRLADRRAETLLLPVAISIGMSEPEARRIIASAQGREERP